MYGAGTGVEVAPRLELTLGSVQMAKVGFSDLTLCDIDFPFIAFSGTADRSSLQACGCGTFGSLSLVRKNSTVIWPSLSTHFMSSMSSFPIAVSSVKKG